MPLTGQFPTVFSLANLNGQNGFKIDGAAAGDNSGQSVSLAGDINGDNHPDLLIGSPGSSNPCAHVLFGGPGVGSAGIINLSSLNGANGFKLAAEAGNKLGYSVAAAGDINGDNKADMLIGDKNYAALKGRSYIVFGGSGVGSSGLVNLTMLNGGNGFKIDGETTGSDFSGISLSTAGDINGDTHTDFLIGSYHGSNSAGRSYVVFGGSGVGSGGLLNLTSLNGSNGFKIDAEAGGDQAISVAAVGDVNGDTRADILIGASCHLYNSSTTYCGTGRSYVLFGGPGVGSSGLLNLTTLNGANGFKIDGETQGDSSGYSVGSAGDINGDSKPDLLIGAFNHNNQAGRSYVVFGGSGVGGSGLIKLSNLNGTNGFKLDGQASDISGFSLSAAGDINGDNYPDLLIGNNGNTLRHNYVVFGGPGVGSSGLITLGNLNGTNGFRLDGEVSASNDLNGWSVSSAGDINGDGYADLLIGAPWYNGGSSGGYGRSYVIFGDSPPVLVNNNLVVLHTKNVTLSSTNFAAYDKNHNNATLTFVPSNMTHGQFELISSPGVALANFTQQQVTGNLVQFIHDGGFQAPSFNIGVYSPGIAYVPPSPTNISFIPLLYWQTNKLIINQGEQVLMTPSFLNISSADSPNLVNFTVSNLQHGQFQLANNSIIQFNEQQLSAGQIYFQQDGSNIAPNYTITLSDSYTTLSPLAPNVTFYRQPVWNNNQLIIHQGETALINTSWVNAVDDYPANQVNFTISNLQNGQFQLLPLNNSITQFNQQQLQTGKILFAQDNTANAPSYQLIINDPYFTLAPISANVSFYPGPSFSSNQLVINQGQLVLMTAAFLNITNEAYSPSLVTLKVSSLQNGQFVLTANNNTVTQFTQQQLLSGNISFIQNNSSNAPSYAISISDPYFNIPPANANITFYHRPTFNSSMTIHQGELLPMDTTFLSANDDYPPNQVMFTVTNLQHGQFELSPGNTVVTQFNQQQVQSGLISFQQDNTNNAPSLAISLSDPYFTLSAVTTNVKFFRRPVLINNQLSIHQGENIVMTGTQLNVINDDYPSNQVILTINNLSNGQFILLPSNNSVTQFTQQQLTSGQVMFAQGGYPNSPSYDVVVSDPYFNLTASSATVLFTPMPPILVHNNLSALQNRSTILSTANLLATDPDPSLDPSQLIFNISNVQHGQFSLVSTPTTAITQFTQTQVNNGQVQFVDNGDLVSPAYTVSVTDGRLSTAFQSANISFDLAPTFSINQLNIARGQTIRLDATQIAASDDHATPSQLLFAVQSILYGHFSATQASGTVITSFTQDAINNGQIQFTQDGSDQQPAYTLTVTDNVGLTAGPKDADITFDINPISTGSNNTVRNAIIGGVVSGAVGLIFLGLKIWINRKADQYLEKATQKDGTLKQQADFKHNILQPIAKKVLESINFKGFMGYISDRTMNDAVDVVAGLIHELQSQGVDVDLAKMSALEQNRVLTTIGRQTRRILVPEASCCSTTQFARFFCSETTPQKMEDKTSEIAIAIKAILNKNLGALLSTSSSTQVESPVNPDTTIEMETLSM